MTTKGSGRTRLGVGLIGLGRLGRVYARDLASRIPETRLVAVADTNAAATDEVARQYDVAGAYADPERLLDDPQVEAVVIASPPHTHRELVVAAAERRRPGFCEKPPPPSPSETLALKEAGERHGTFFPMGVIRGFDTRYP